MWRSVFLLVLAIVALPRAVRCAPSIMTSMPYRRLHNSERCVKVAVTDEHCQAAAVLLSTNQSTPTAEWLHVIDQARTGVLANPYETITPLFEQGAGVFSGIPSGQVCTEHNTMVLVCLNKGPIDDAVVVHMTSAALTGTRWNTTVVVRQQACDYVALDVAVATDAPDNPVVYGVAKWDSGTQLDKVWIAPGDNRARTLVLPRSLQSWHHSVYLNFVGPDRVDSIVIPPPKIDCNSSFYADEIERIQRFHGVDNLDHFRFEWKHARPTVVSVLWSFVLGAFQMALCIGVFWKRQRVFLVCCLLLMSIHIPLVGHIKFDAYIIATAAGLLLPFVIGPAIVTWWLLAHPIQAFKLPDRVVADNLFMCLLVVLLHGTFLLVSVIQTTS